MVERAGRMLNTIANISLIEDKKWYWNSLLSHSLFFPLGINKETEVIEDQSRAVFHNSFLSFYI